MSPRKGSAGQQERQALKGSSKRASAKPRAEKRAQLVSEISDQQRRQEVIDAVHMARAIAISGLPRSRTPERSISRVIRMGSALWLKVKYTQVLDGVDLPFGEDRFALAAIQHLAVEQKSPTILFRRVNHLLEMFGLPDDGRELGLLRERLQRLSGLVISLVFANSRDGVNSPHVGENIFIIRRYVLPTRQELHLESGGQLRLPSLDDDPDMKQTPYGVVLNRDFYDHLQDTKNLVSVPPDLLRLFVSRPLGWDYLCFLVARCARARSTSIIDQSAILDLFGGPTERPRRTIERLMDYHDEITLATAGKLNAHLEEARPAKSTGGRPAKRWQLRVGPSESLLGQPVAPLALPAASGSTEGTLPPGCR